MATLTLHELPPSPNNLRVRLALKFKGLDYVTQVVPFDSDRSELVELSTQPLTPVLTHGEVVVFDSSAILRYLEANFPDTPRLFSSDRDELKAIEDWEYYARIELIKPVGMTFEQAFAPVADPAAIAAANDCLHAASARVEEALSDGRDYLLGSRLTAADLFAAPLIATVNMPVDSPVPVVAFFGKHLNLREGRERTAAWVARVMALDV